MADNGVPNGLINEQSPYLLQHAYNPVKWLPWGEEAFQKARAEDKPVFLSIGYSTCHWCHVMERESFEDEEVAEYLNSAFIPIKVDREERPDIDHIYMEFCQMSTGSGGWPLTIFLTPEKKPFYAGTYFPKEDARGLPGIITLLHHIRRVWENDRASITEYSSRVLKAMSPVRKPGGDDITISNKAVFDQLTTAFDPIYGGFGKVPKFPTPVNLLFLLRYWHITKEAKAKDMVTKTLDGMAKGGIFDHIGYGFSRYSTDRKWLVPHFEKMLYDNAQLAMVYLEAYQAFGLDEYAQTAKRIFEYIQRDMLSTEGAFYSAEDADSEGVEGKFYVWSYDEILDLLGTERGKRLCKLFNITAGGNFEGKNIPNLIGIVLVKDDEEFIDECRKELFLIREKRIHPFKDDKILTSWNALMIAAMAYGGRVLKDPGLVKTAGKALECICSTLFDSTGRLQARYRKGEAAIPAYSEDYVFLIWALIEMFEADFSAGHLRKAINLCEETIRLFWDGEGGGLFLYGNDMPAQITRPKVSYDGAIPSANSIFAYCLARLSKMTVRIDLEENAWKIIRLFESDMADYPTGHAMMAVAKMLLEEPGEHITIVCKPDENINENPAFELVRTTYLPFASIIALTEGNESLKDVVPGIDKYMTVNEKTTVYLCKGMNCLPPITDENVLKTKLS